MGYRFEKIILFHFTNSDSASHIMQEKHGQIFNDMAPWNVIFMRRPSNPHNRGFLGQFSNHKLLHPTRICRSGSGCSKLTTALVNVSLKYLKLISQICQ